MAQDPLRLFKELISAAASVEILLQPQYSTAVQTLCEKAPTIAQFLAEEIPKHLKEGGERDDDDEEPESSYVRSRKRSRQSDPSYQPPKSVKASFEGLPGSRPSSTVLPGNSSSALIPAHGGSYSAPVLRTSLDDIESDLLPPTNADVAGVDKGIPIQGQPTVVNDGARADAEPPSAIQVSAQAQSGRLAGGQPQAHPPTALAAENTTDEIPSHLPPAAPSLEQERQRTKQDVIRSTTEAQIALPHGLSRSSHAKRFPHEGFKPFAMLGIDRNQDLKIPGAEDVY
ncbi:hypothetical protein QBC46DRAFT_412953 [Diplogelasinospora grovesii]|uniref:Uncharacterized protein n=1 Tax=Diplogelasinospora grovesii TaxID=303347 RepID=A0AAN6N0B6_9PEZI|nr:hypothetical protein QBC46DRAFT_412953 [Diplogelasinospora grovesii]